MRARREKLGRVGSWLGAWLVAQVGGAAGIVLNWQSRPAYVILAALYAALLIAGGIGIAALARRSLDLVPARSPWWIALLAGIVCAGWAVPAEPAYPLDALRWLLTLGAAFVGAVILRPAISRRAAGWAVAACALLIAWSSLLALRVYPPVHTDEGWMLNKAWTSAHTGPVYAPSINLGIHGDPQRINAELIWYPLGGWLRLVGLGWWQGRAAMGLIGLLAAALTAWAARLLYGPRAGWIAGLLAASSVLMFYTAHYFRPEILLNTAIAGALVLHALAEKHRSFGAAFALGLLLALAVDIHPNAFVYCFAFGAFYTARAAWQSHRAGRLRADPRWLGLAAGGAAGALIYLAGRAAPDPVAFGEQARYYYQISYSTTTDLTPAGLRERVLVTLNHLRSWYAFSLAEANAALLAAVHTLWTRIPASLGLLAVLALCFVGWVILGSRRVPAYISAVLPVASVLVAGALVQLAPDRARALALSAVLIAAVWGVSLRESLNAQRDGVNARFEDCRAELARRLPGEGMILGEHLFWLARPRLDGYASRTLVEQPWPGRSADEQMAQLDPDVVIWPGPVSGAAAAYVLSNGYQLAEVPACAPFVTLWLRPGVMLGP